MIWNLLKLPKMYKITCEYLAIPTSLMPSEEANSKAHYHDNFEDRFQLHACTFKVMMCNRSWLDLLHGANISITKDINDRYNSFDRQYWFRRHDEKGWCCGILVLGQVMNF